MSAVIQFMVLFRFVGCDAESTGGFLWPASPGPACGGAASQGDFGSSCEKPKISTILDIQAGLTYDEALEIRRRLVNPAAELYFERPLMLSHGERQFLFDSDGRRYLDLLGGAFSVI